jgi:hypothetical protein
MAKVREKSGHDIERDKNFKQQEDGFGHNFQELQVWKA